MLDTVKALFGWPWFPRKPKPPPPPPKPLPEVERDVAYGDDPLQKADIDRPPGMVEGDTAITDVMVHGGGWQNDKGDKANDGVIDAKLAHFLALGDMVASTNYRLYPAVTPLQEQQDVSAALAFVQKQAGCGPVVLMGHSAGGHLAALATALGAVLAHLVADNTANDRAADRAEAAFVLGNLAAEQAAGDGADNHASLA